MTLCMYSKPPGHYKPDKVGLVTLDNTNPTVHVRAPVLALVTLVVVDVDVILVILVVDPLGTKLRQKKVYQITNKTTQYIFC